MKLTYSYVYSNQTVTEISISEGKQIVELDKNSNSN